MPIGRAVDDEPAVGEAGAGLVDAAQDAVQQVDWGVLSALALSHRARSPRPAPRDP